jgi:hypothetical protein
VSIIRPHKFAVVMLFSSLAFATSLHAAPVLTLGNVSGEAGTEVSLPITFNPGGASIASAQFELTLPPSISTVSVTAGETLAAAGKTITTRVDGQKWKFLIFGLNQDTSKTGTLATLRLRIAPGTGAGSLSIPFSGVVYADPAGKAITPGANKAGKIKIQKGPAPAKAS